MLSEDYFTVAEDRIPAITSDLTVVGGRVVHAAGAFAALPLERHGTRHAPAATAGAAVRAGAR
ncbi:hypothetical protein BJF78_11510 [Pseudonocardia sp. CNS-139]|nr:hypothetical protein BJF78_11510 [Pseudonocardia sp. CNS-139]